MGAKLGMDAVLYRNTGTHDTPVWTPMNNVKDLTLNLEKGEADATTRAAAGWKQYLPTLRDGSVEFESVWDAEDDGFEALRNAYFTNASIELAVMDGDITTPGSEGLVATMGVMNFSRTESLEEVISASVTLKPAYAAVPPTWLIVV